MNRNSTEGLRCLLSKPRICICFLPSLLTGLSPEWAEGQDKDAKLATSKLVATQEGTLPIILSAPHGGDQPVPGVPERKGEGLIKGPSGFFTGRDVGTEQLCYEAAKAIEAKMGKKPYYVVARFHRKFIDPNRPADIAYERPGQAESTTFTMIRSPIIVALC